MNSNYFLQITATLLILLTIAAGQAAGQIVNGKPLKPIGGDILNVDGRLFKEKVTVLEIVDGVIDTENFVPGADVSAGWVIRDSTSVRRIVDAKVDSVVIVNTKNTVLENYVFKRLKNEIEGLPYKVPIILNERFIEWYLMRRESYRFIKSTDIKRIKFLPREEAQKKYGNTLVFGVIEIYKE